jgi:glycosyltransferase involved in cell wall biosynthesis
MKILTFSTLFPNAIQPYHGVFVENRLRHLLDRCEGIEPHVIAPVPWFPFTGGVFGQYGQYAAVAQQEQRHGLTIDHPRYPVIPKVGMTLAPLLLYASVRQPVQRLIDSGFDFDLIDAHYFYPDGIAAAMLGQRLGKPVIITARGTDLNLIPQYALPRRMIVWAASRAAAMITVCAALKDSLVDLGVDGDRVTVLRNGVDLHMFQPGDREKIRGELGLNGQTLISVGHLIPRKGHDIVIRALSHLPGVNLLIAGDGPEDANLRTIARDAGVEDRVNFLGRQPHERLPELYRAADALVLASSREGWANVLLEAMACGTPVVASNVWGTPEVVAKPEAGQLMADRTPEALAEAVRVLFADLPDRAATRAYAENFSWDATSDGQRDLFGKVLASTSMSSVGPAFATNRP